VEAGRITGIDPFPALPAAIKASAIPLPMPRPNGQKLNISPVPEQALGLGGGKSDKHDLRANHCGGWRQRRIPAQADS